MNSANQWLRVMFGQEGRNHLAETLWLLNVRHVARLVEQDPFRTGDLLVNGVHDQRSRLVVLTRHEQRRRSDLVQLIGDIPILQRADAVEL